MKILLLTPLFHPDKGGAALAFNYLSRIFADNERVSEVLVLTSYKKGKKRCRKNGKINVLRLLNYGITHHSQPIFACTWNVLVIREIIKRFAPGMIVFHSIILPFRDYYRELFKNSPSKYIYLYKTDLYPVRDFPGLTGVVYLSENLEEMLVRDWKIPGSKLIYAPIFFRPPRKNKIHQPAKPYPFEYILYVGSVNPLKGVYELIRAFKIIKNEFRHLKLVVMGPGPTGISYDRDVIFPPAGERREVYRHIRHTRMVVLPSYTEGLPRVALETLYLNKPLIISDVVTETWCLEPSQIVNKIEPEEIARKIRGILKGAPYTTDFPWEAIAFKRSKEIWSEIINDGIDAAGRFESSTRDVADDCLSTAELKSLRESAKTAAAAIVNADGFTAVPTEVEREMPGLAKVDYIFFFKTLNPQNRLDHFCAVTQTPYLMDHEKKELLKRMMIKLETRYGIYLDAGVLQLHFLPLVPLTSVDMLFLGEYFLRGRCLTEAKKFLLKGLNLLPEKPHLEIYRQLLAFLDEVLKIGEKEEIKKNFRVFLEELKEEDMIDILDEHHLKFIGQFTDIEKVFETCLRQIQTGVGSIAFQAKLYFLAASYKKMMGAGELRLYLKKAVAALTEKKSRQPHETYQLASCYKRLQDSRKAAAGFRKVLETTMDPRLISGAYFHLGEIAYTGKRLKQAGEYFTRCLELNPGHNKAGAYLNRLKEEAR